jgi:hypothetical protein
VSLPVAIGAHLVHHYRAVFASVPSEIPLSIALHIQATDYNPALHWLFPNRGVDFLAPLWDVTRKPDINR